MNQPHRGYWMQYLGLKSGIAKRVQKENKGIYNYWNREYNAEDNAKVKTK